MKKDVHFFVTSMIALVQSSMFLWRILYFALSIAVVFYRMLSMYWIFICVLRLLLLYSGLSSFVCPASNTVIPSEKLLSFVLWLNFDLSRLSPLVGDHGTVGHSYAGNIVMEHDTHVGTSTYRLCCPGGQVADSQRTAIACHCFTGNSAFVRVQRLWIRFYARCIRVERRRGEHVVSSSSFE